MTSTAQDLIDQLRTETIAEVIAHLEQWQASLSEEDHYHDGVSDSIITVRELLT